jgi:serine/threonine-protein kinase
MHGPRFSQTDARRDVDRHRSVAGTLAAVTPPHDARLGTILGGRYRLDRALAAGGMGAIYEAENLSIGKRVAVKLLHAHYAGDADIVARFRREALAATAIGNEHVIEVLDLGTADDGAVFMVLELLEGHDLAAEIRARGPLPVADVIDVVSQICEALEAVHAKEIVHRDLKPENVFLTRRGGHPRFVKVLDFGISKVKAAFGTPEEAATRTGTALGTPYYMAPEQARGAKDVDHRVDLYALGVILFRALTGQHPFDDGSFPLLIVKICTEPPPPVRLYRGDVPDELEAIITRLLAKDRGLRFGSARALREALAPFRSLTAAPLLLEAPPTSSLAPKALDALERAGYAATQLAPGSLPPARPWSERAPRSDDDDDAQHAEAEAKALGARPRWLPLAGLALVVLAGATVATALFGERKPRPTRAESHTLPTPGDARTAPLSGPDRRGGEGWRWLNLLPRALPTYLGLDVGGPGLVAMVGRRGAAARITPQGLAAWASGTTEDLEAVTYAGAREALAVGARGTIVRLGEGPPVNLASGTTQALHAVAAVSPTEAIAAGDAGTLLRIVDRRVTPLDAAAATGGAALRAVAVVGADVVAVGEAGTIVRIGTEGVSRERNANRATLRGVGGCAGGTLYAAGDGGVVLRRVAANDWRPLRDTGTTAWTAIDCDGDRVAIAGSRGEVLLVQGDRAVRLGSGADRPWYAVAGARGERSWLVGAGGRLASIHDDHVRLLTDGPTGAIRDLGSLGGALVAVGEYGRIARERESGFAAGTSPTSSGLGGLAALGPDALLAVGDDGAIVEILADRARLHASPVRQPWRDVVARDGEVLVVGGEGTLLRGPLPALLATRVPETGDLAAIAGTPDDALVVGADGAVLFVDAARTTRLPCPPAVGRMLRGTVRGASPNTPTAGDARSARGGWAAGDGGIIVAITEDGCRVEHDGGATLHALGLGPHGRPLAVGDDGTALERSATGAWETVPLEVAGHSLRAVVRDERYVYLAGTGGVVLRHVLLDGT